MKQVKSFQCEDGRLFTDKVAALKHDFGLEVKGFIQTKIGGNNSNYTASQIADVITKNSTEFAKILGKYRGQITVANKNNCQLIPVKQSVTENS